MEAKQFGVKKSLLKELRLFQSSLKKKRKMFFDVEMRGNIGSLQTRIMTREGRVVIAIEGFAPFYVRKEDYSEHGPTQISIVFAGLLDLHIKFESTEYKEAFRREISREWTPSPPRDE